jgi:hypothetical protein
MDDLYDELHDELSDELSGGSSGDTPVVLPRGGSADNKKIIQPETLNDELFSIKISEDMGVRNALRTGLVEAQGKDTGKMPMYVSWPGWLDDGIVCMFARDFRELLDRAVKEAAVSFGKTLNASEQNNVKTAGIRDAAPTPVAGQKAAKGEVESFTLPELGEDS